MAKVSKSEQQELDAVKYRKAKMDRILFSAMESMQKPTKWGITLDGSIVELYPVPTFNQDCTIKSIE